MIVMKKIILIAVLWISFSSCFKNYFSVRSTTEITDSALEKIQARGNTVILHTDNKTVELIDMKVSKDKIEANVLPHYPLKPGYEEPDPGRRIHPYKRAHKAELMNQVHIYAPADFSDNKQVVTLKQNQITKVTVYHPAKTATTLSKVGGVLLIASVLAIALGIGIATAQYTVW